PIVRTSNAHRRRRLGGVDSPARQQCRQWGGEDRTRELLHGNPSRAGGRRQAWLGALLSAGLRSNRDDLWSKASASGCSAGASRQLDDRATRTWGCRLLSPLVAAGRAGPDSDSMAHLQTAADLIVRVAITASLSNRCRCPMRTTPSLKGASRHGGTSKFTRLTSPRVITHLC